MAELNDTLVRGSLRVIGDTVVGNLSVSGSLTVNGYSVVTSAQFGGTYFESGNSSNGVHDANSVTYNAHDYYTSNGPSTSIGASTGDGALYTQAYSSDWVAQIAQDYRNGRLFVRGKNSGSWQDWKRIAQYDELPTESTVSGWGFTKNIGTVTSITLGLVAYTPDSGGVVALPAYPTALPADGGNADTVDGEHAVAFAHRGVGNNLITAGNEFNFIPSGYGGQDGAAVWINYTTDSRDNTGNITEYILGNGRGQALGNIIHTGNIGSQNVNYANSAGNADTLDNHDSSYFYPASNPNSYTSVTETTVTNWGFTKTQGTVTLVRVQAGTGLTSSQNAPQTETLNTTISIASGYKLPTTDEWSSKLDMSDVFGFGDDVMEAFIDGNYPSFIKLVNDGNDNPKFEFDTTNYSVVSGVNDSTNWTSITINGVTKNIPSGGSGGGITEISTQYIRIWDLNPGIYLLTYNGTKYIYYSGASGTATHTVKGGSGKVILTVETYSTTTKSWHYDSINASLGLNSYTRFYGRTSSSSGTTSSTLLAPKYKHTILFTVNGYGSCKYDFINNSSSNISVTELINELIGKALGDMSETSGDAYFVFGNQNGDKLNPTINCTRYSVYNGTTINYVVGGGASLTINSQAATQI